MLASDLNNPEFANPSNPDDLLHVEFFMDDEINAWETKRQTLINGTKTLIYNMDGDKRKRSAYVRIMRPGDNTSIVVEKVRDDHKKRWPQKWLYFQMSQGNQIPGQDVPGWKVETWDKVSPEQLKFLTYHGFHTVEQIAGASDDQVQRIGMSGPGLRETAKNDLRNRISAGAKAEIEKRDAIIQEQGMQLQKQAMDLQDLAGKFDQMMAMMNKSPDPVPQSFAGTDNLQASPVAEHADVVVETKKRGRPKKVEVQHHPV